MPDLRRLPIVLPVRRVDAPKERRVETSRVGKAPLGVIVLVVPQVGLVRLARRRDRQHQRLTPGSTAVPKGIPQPAVPPLSVQLVEQQAGDVEPLGPERIRRQHAVERVAPTMHDRLSRVENLKNLRQSRRRADHRRGFTVDDASLLAVRCRTVDLGPGFAVGHQHVEGDAGE